VERLRVLRHQSTEIRDRLRRERENHVLRKNQERATLSSDGPRKIG
jgi:hypothetical protein